MIIIYVVHEDYDFGELNYWHGDTRIILEVCHEKKSSAVSYSVDPLISNISESWGQYNICILYNYCDISDLTPRRLDDKP